MCSNHFSREDGCIIPPSHDGASILKHNNVPTVFTQATFFTYGISRTARRRMENPWDAQNIIKADKVSHDHRCCKQVQPESTDSSDLEDKLRRKIFIATVETI